MQLDPQSLAMDNVVVALLASLITIGVTKLLDLFQARQQHKFRMQQTYVARKLKVAEATAIEVTKVEYALRALTALMEEAQEGTISDAVWKHFSESFHEELEKVQDMGGWSSSALPLYFDFSLESALDIETLRELWMTLTRVDATVDHLRILERRRSAADDPAERQALGQRLYTQRESFADRVEEYTAVMSRLSADLREVLVKTRADLRHLEPYSE